MNKDERALIRLQGEEQIRLLTEILAELKKLSSTPKPDLWWNGKDVSEIMKERKKQIGGR